MQKPHQKPFATYQCRSDSCELHAICFGKAMFTLIRAHQYSYLRTKTICRSASKPMLRNDKYFLSSSIDNKAFITCTGLLWTPKDSKNLKQTPDQTDRRIPQHLGESLKRLRSFSIPSPLDCCRSAREFHFRAVTSRHASHAKHLFIAIFHMNFFFDQ